MKIRNLEERLGNKLVENESLKKELALMSTQIEELQSEGQVWQFVTQRRDLLKDEQILLVRDTLEEHNC